MYKRVKKGEIYKANLSNKAVGSVQKGRRPVIVYSCNENNFFSTTINVIPLTSEIKDLCVHVPIEGFGLDEPSTILVEQITTIDKIQLDYKIGKVSKDIMDKIDYAVDLQFGRIKKKKNKELVSQHG